ncbi:hypothetical protein EYF80_039179 [Liparis tanakae]|uniref:Uncharacterized protein n=1 Tax=Liparis tanakae TaxID=230148 RepID=A0A4Z2GBX6_9TELE|nr:hypothetical protein EYF80_039179 [Liparis tanakae]
MEVAEPDDAGVQMAAHGSRAPIHGRPPAQVQQRWRPSKTPSSTTKTSRLGSTGRTCKIRNYNHVNMCSGGDGERWYAGKQHPAGTHTSTGGGVLQPSAVEMWSSWLKTASTLTRYPMTAERV